MSIKKNTNYPEYRKRQSGLFCVISCFMAVLFSLLLSGVALADSPATKMLSCPEKNHNLIKGYKISHKEENITIFLCDRKSITPKNDDAQKQVSDPLVSKDQKYIGWTVFEDTDFSSYPISTHVTFYSGGKIYHATGEFGVVHDWHYSSRKGAVILELMTLHGMSEPSVDEYDIKTGKKIRHIKDGN